MKGLLCPLGASTLPTLGQSGFSAYNTAQAGERTLSLPLGKQDIVPSHQPNSGDFAVKRSLSLLLPIIFAALTIGCEPSTPTGEVDLSTDRETPPAPEPVEAVSSNTTGNTTGTVMMPGSNMTGSNVTGTGTMMVEEY